MPERRLWRHGGKNTQVKGRRGSRTVQVDYSGLIGRPDVRRKRRRKKKKEKKTADVLFHHAQKRALQRYDLELSRHEYDRMISAIRNHHDVNFLKRESYSRTHWLVFDKYIVVYNNVAKGIATFLPPEAIWGYLGANQIQEKQATG